MIDVSVLFARADSVYKSLPGCDVWDTERDARRFIGCGPVIVHPPCRAWGRLRRFANPRPDEMDLARFAVATVRRNGGVLEHPAESTLWGDQLMPWPGRAPDAFGGWSMAVDQFHFGHQAQKPTWLYIVGLSPDDLPAVPHRVGAPTRCIRPGKNTVGLPSLPKADREHTPVDLARWLVDVAAACVPTVWPNSPLFLEAKPYNAGMMQGNAHGGPGFALAARGRQAEFPFA